MDPMQKAHDSLRAIDEMHAKPELHAWGCAVRGLCSLFPLEPLPALNPNGSRQLRRLDAQHGGGTGCFAVVAPIQSATTHPASSARFFFSFYPQSGLNRQEAHHGCNNICPGAD